MLISLWKLFRFFRYKFCPEFFDHLRKRFDKIRLMLTSPFMTTPTGKQNIIMHILPNIQKSNGYETNEMSSFNTIEQKYFSWKIVHVLKKLVPDHFLSKENWTRLCINSLKICSCFLIYFQVENYQICWNQSSDRFSLPHLKTKRCLELVFFPHFLSDFS